MCKKLKVMMMTIGMLMSSCLSLLAQGLTTLVADSYVGTLSVTIEGERYDHKDIRMNVEKCADGSLNLSVEDFKLVRGSEVKPIGNFSLTGVRLDKKTDTFLVDVSSSQKITIANGYIFSGIAVDDGRGDDVIGGGSSSDVTPSDNDNDGKDDKSEVKEEKDGLNTIEGEDQEAEGEWGDAESGTGSGSSGIGSGSGDSGNGSGGSGNSGTEQKEPEWYGPTYGVMSVDVEGVVFKEYAELAFDVYIASLNKTLRVTFRSGNVPTRIVVVKTGSKKTSRGYTLSGIPVSASYRGVVVGN